LAATGNVQVDPITGLPIDTGSISGSESSLLVPYGTGEEKEKSLSDLLYGTIPSGTAPSNTIGGY